MNKLPGYKKIKAEVKIKADVDAKTLAELHAHVLKTSPVGLTLSRPLEMETKLVTL
jgi:hypothetical protein